MLSKLLAATAGVAIACCAFAAPGGAASASACNAQSGVTVIVDFTHFGGDIERGCDPGQPQTALDALHTAGFVTAGTARYGDAFVCRIDGRPSPAHEACTDTPPASSSWSFYFARPSDRRWTYSAAGVLSYRPPAGSLVAFAFGDVARPGVLPSGATVTTTTTTTAPPRPTTPRTVPPVTALAEPPGTVPPPGVTGPPTTVAAPPPPSPPTTRTRTAHPTTTTRAVATTSGPRIVDKTASEPVTGIDDSGSAFPAIVTVILVVALGAGAFAVIRSRRRRAA